MPLARSLTWCARVNILADRGELREGDKAPLLEALQQFDEIFAVLKDDDAEKMKAAMEWARSHGILKDSEVPADAMSDAERESPD